MSLSALERPATCASCAGRAALEAVEAARSWSLLPAARLGSLAGSGRD